MKVEILCSKVKDAEQSLQDAYKRLVKIWTSEDYTMDERVLAWKADASQNWLQSGRELPGLLGGIYEQMLDSYLDHGMRYIQIDLLDELSVLCDNYIYSAWGTKNYFPDLEGDEFQEWLTPRWERLERWIIRSFIKHNISRTFQLDW